MPHKRPELALNDLCLFVDAAVQCYRLSICPEAGMQLPVGPCALFNSVIPSVEIC